MLYSAEGITERVRTDLTGPDGRPGIDISGRSMSNMYLEMSKGAYTVGRGATGHRRGGRAGSDGPGLPVGGLRHRGSGRPGRGWELPEDAGVGVFAHEYGHDLGLPDLYDTSGNADSDVDFWDLMGSGSHSGEIFQALPTHMGLWDKWVLGWADPLTVGVGAEARTVQLGQTSRTPVGTEDGIKVNLPDKVITLATPHGGATMWHSGGDQDWADVKLSRQVAVPAAGDARFWMWNNYTIEENWDYGFVEVSAYGGETWTELKVRDAAGNLVSTDDGYADPNGRMSDFGGKKYGLTGDSHGWRHDWVDLSPYAGTTVQLRLHYATDAAFLERGWFPTTSR